METPANPSSLTEELASALDWWRDAGVDADYREDATDWLAEEVAAATPEPPAEPHSKAAKAPAKRPLGVSAEKSREPIGGDRSAWPQDLTAFRQWWLEETSLDEGGPNPRIAPRGEAGAKLMIVIAQPEIEDRNALLSGPQGRLLANMLRAMGLASQEVYFASALPRHAPLPDWRVLEAAGLGALLSHHITLAAPKRLLLLGRSVLSLIPHEPAQGSVALQEFNHETATIASAAGAGLDMLLAQPREQARFWRRWLEWAA